MSDANAAGATLRLADYTTRASWDDLGEPVVRHAMRSFVNVFGCAMGGSQHRAIEIAEQSFCNQDPSGSSIVIGRRRRTSAMHSALLNALSSSVYAFDDGHAEAIVHPSSPVWAALIGLSGSVQAPIDGRQFLLAFSLGIEIVCRLSKSISVAPAQAPVGWSQSGITGSIGAAAACSKLINLDMHETAAAMGIAASLASGLRVAHGTMAMHLLPAQAAMLGVEAALLAGGGFTGPTQALEGQYGFLSLHTDQSVADALTGDLGQHYELLANCLKAYPCGIVIHSVIDACLQLRQKYGFDPSNIAAIRITVSKTTAALANRQHPRTEFEAQVSIQHWAAASLLEGAAGIEQGMPNAIDDPTIGQLREKCQVIVDPAMSSSTAVVALEFKKGPVLEYRVDQYRGSLSKPLSDDDINRKYLEQSEPIIGAIAAQSALDHCWSLPATSDVKELFGKIHRETGFGPRQ